MTNEPETTEIVPVEDTPETVTMKSKESLAWDIAHNLATEAQDLLPERWRGKPKAVYQMVMQARELGIEPIAACRLTYLVHGQPCLKTEAVIGLVNKHGGMASELMFEVKGEFPNKDFGVRCWAISSRSGERLDSIWVTLEMADEQGWTKKAGNKYKGPFAEQMLRYRSAGFWARVFAPEVMMGMYTEQEVREIPDEPKLSPAMEALQLRSRGVTEIVEPVVESEPEAQEAATEDALQGHCEDCGTPPPDPHEEYCPSLFASGEQA